MKKNKIFKYLFGSLAGVVLAGAVIGGVVSCSNGSSASTTTSNQPQTQSPTTSTNSAPAYQLATGPNNSAMAYKDPTPSMSLVATNTISDYSTLINEPNNVIISVLGQPEAVINVANANENNVPNITLNLNPNSTLYQQVSNGTNTKADLADLTNLISFSTTNGSTEKINIQNYSSVASSSQTFSLESFETTWTWQSDNVISHVEKFSNGLFGAITPTNLWNDIHAKTPTATFTTTDEIYWSNVNQTPTPFNFTINLLPFIQYSNVHPTLTFAKTPTVNKKDNTINISNVVSNSWELSGIPTSDMQSVGNADTWYANTVKSFPGFSFTSIVLPYNAATNQIPSVPYMYFDNGMIIVGTTAPSSI